MGKQARVKDVSWTGNVVKNTGEYMLSANYDCCLRCCWYSRNCRKYVLCANDQLHIGILVLLAHRLAPGVHNDLARRAELLNFGPCQTMG